MKTNFRICIIGLGLVTGLLACSDHRLSLIAQQNVQLKKLTTIYSRGIAGLDGTIVIDEFTYDNTHRLISKRRFSPQTTSFTRTDYFYDSQNRLIRFDVVDPTGAKDNARTESTYSSDGQSAIVKRSVTPDNFNTFSLVTQQTIVFNDKGQVVKVTSGREEYIYTYANGNIISTLQTIYSLSNIILSRTEIAYEYDSQPNPHFGIPDDDLTNQYRYNKNNVTKVLLKSINPADGAVSLQPVNTNTLTYNSQNLPTSLSIVSISGTIGNGQPIHEDYEYETY